MLLLFTSAPISFFRSSEEVSIAILFIFSGAPFLSNIISCSAFLISSSICLSITSFLELIPLRALSLASLKMFFGETFDKQKQRKRSCYMSRLLQNTY